MPPLVEGALCTWFTMRIWSQYGFLRISPTT
jgi:hypothetical protein